jgi:hypothetical protein
MNTNTTTRSGYILVMALMIISLVVLITGIMTNIGDSYVPYMHAMAQRDKARLLALGGIACAQSQLGMSVEVDDPGSAKATPGGAKKEGTQQAEGQKQKAPTLDQEATSLLKNLLPIINTWQTVPLTLEKEGIDGIIQFRIACEDGKLNINELFDFNTKKFKDEKKGDQSIKAILTTLLAPVEKRMKTPELVSALESMLAKRGYPLNDVTELLTNTSFAGFKHAQLPSFEPHNKKSADTPPFALTDLFTTHTNRMTIEPWLMSEAVRRIYGIPEQGEKKEHKKDAQEKITELLKKFKTAADWNKDWDERLQPFYGIPFKQLPKQSSLLFAKSFDPRIFSVIVQATVGDSTQRLYAILERIKKSQDTKTQYDIYIRTFYWI